MDNVLEIKDLEFSYSDATVLRNINLSLEKGDFLGIIGSNGTGKSTLIKLILGILQYNSGSIRLFGEERKNFKDYSKIGYVSQKANSFNSSFPATVKEVILANLYSKIGLFGKPKKEHIEAMKKALEVVGMSGFENRLIGKMSGGQQQRIFIARILVNNPELMFLDEPTVGVDAPSVDAITDIIKKLNAQGITIVMTNHDTPSLVTLANKLLVLHTDGCASFYNKNDLSVDELAKLMKGGYHNHA